MPIEEITIAEAARDWRAFDDVIDVRSESEFAEDHIPGAINLPALSDAERAEVGTVYVRESRFLARKIGAAYVARNTARHLENALADKPGGYAPLVHCWRGGQRSRGLAIILDQIGWRVRSLKGGYKAYRRVVTEKLYDAEPWFDVVLLDGPTGVGKTEILKRLGASGAATLDLEALAAHRGSIFGADPARPQPSQKLFETQVLAELEAGLAGANRSPDGRPTRATVFLEAESSKIGRLLTPPALWKAMLTAPVVRIEAPLDARARFSVEQYGDLIADPGRLDALLTRLIPLAGREEVDAWRAMARRREHVALAKGLMERHYDPAYARSGRRPARRRLGAVRLDRLDAAAFDAAAAKILRLTREAGAGFDPAARLNRSDVA